MNDKIRKIDALEKIYAVFDRFAQDSEVACAKKCAACCTTDVTLTTLEAYRLWRALGRAEQEALGHRLDGAAKSARFRPLLTTNQLAEICAAGDDPPDEKNPAPAGRCPLLSDELCSLYGWRPFHCRCMVSQSACGASGCAEMDDFTLTLNTVFLQVIEHLDTPGCSGNLLDVIPLMLTKQGRHEYETSALACPQNALVANRPLKILMVPPEHRDRLAPIIDALRSIRI